MGRVMNEYRDVMEAYEEGKEGRSEKEKETETENGNRGKKRF